MTDKDILLAEIKQVKEQATREAVKSGKSPEAARQDAIFELIYTKCKKAFIALSNR